MAAGVEALVVLMSGTPGIQVKRFHHRDGTPFYAIARGSWAWLKLTPTELRTVADQLHQAADEMEQENAQ